MRAYNSLSQTGTWGYVTRQGPLSDLHPVNFCFCCIFTNRFWIKWTEPVDTWEAWALVCIQPGYNTFWMSFGFALVSQVLSPNITNAPVAEWDQISTSWLQDHVKAPRRAQFAISTCLYPSSGCHVQQSHESLIFRFLHTCEMNGIFIISVTAQSASGHSIGSRHKTSLCMLYSFPSIISLHIFPISLLSAHIPSPSLCDLTPHLPLTSFFPPWGIPETALSNALNYTHHWFTERGIGAERDACFHLLPPLFSRLLQPARLLSLWAAGE